ncbi:MAG: 50S ribosomal protein L3 [Planctomycetes bacterium]|nr:50S ribosomal protein L3 [Planctomycetota bacterium]
MVMLLGKKVGMTQVYDDTGKMIPVTVIQAGPCVVTQVKTSKSDGYSAVQMGFNDVKKSRVKNPAAGHAKKANTAAKKFVRECRYFDDKEISQSAGDEVTVDVFGENEVKFVDVSGISKGKGFAGCMKRHDFGGFPASHGCKRRHRAPGAISSFASDAGHGGNLKRGKRMAGHMGHVRITSRQNQLISVDSELNLLVVKGCIPGPTGGYVEIRSSKDQKA